MAMGFIGVGLGPRGSEKEVEYDFECFKKGKIN